MEMIWWYPGIDPAWLGGVQVKLEVGEWLSEGQLKTRLRNSPLQNLDPRQL